MNLDSNGVARLIQDYLADSPLVVLGSGSSVPYGLPTMSGLATELRKDTFLQAESNSSKFFTDMDSIGLEAAIDNNPLSENAKKQIRTLTWQCINTADLMFFREKKLEDDIQPLIQLIDKIISTSSNQFTIVTTNYDRLSEYAVDLYGAVTVTGFEGNLLRKFDGFSDYVNNKRIAVRERVVKILKVHGSLDWFIDKDGNIISFPLQEEVPFGCSPLIVPPGKEKYSTTHEEPYRTIIEEADREFKIAGSFLCIGYGFNDSHIQPKLISQIENGKKPIVVITKKATDECKRLVANTNVKKYVILEDAGEETRIISNNGVATVSGNIWSLKEFMEAW